MAIAQHQSTRALASFAAGFDARTLPDEVRRKLGWLFLDHLRVCSIGARLPWSDWSRRYVGLVGRAGNSHVLFEAETVNPQHATFLNVTFGSSFDGDDTHVGAMLHPGVAAWSAALAVGEHTGASGPDVLAAVVAAYETIIRIGLSVQPGHFKRGFQSTGTCDGFGTAAASGRLLFRGKDAAQKIADALGIAGGHAGGLAQFYYSGGSAKRIHAAHAAEGGVAAALLAEQGYSGPNDIIEGQGGFARAYADGFNPAVIEEGLGQRFHLMDVLVKSHAAAARVAAGIDAMLVLREQHGFGSNDIASMALGIPKIIQGRLTNPHPVDLQAAQMCLPFSVALAAKVPLAPGGITTLGIPDYKAGLKDKRLHDIEERTTIALDDEVEAASNELSTAARVSVVLRDGRKFSMLVPAPKGSPSQPFTAAEHEARFIQELAPRGGDKTCGEIVAMSRDLDRLDPRWLGQVLSGKR
ncbi:MmgE/PrpD family protein [Rhodoplanes sp. Z2-YC6860]|uniref:MmgE/PrpD family protein n=1 Tax=Rhodoplanes sp. Z2-YC6860 TaxID=674703 RepID=UPI00078C25FF|nr:MmgE/PrpD family protein [Rhodoplanes sp. Z2-YC6860]AMN43574.1 MmgE/PrpD family protein [Rhodoplanes sp. Z2-YC6860]